MVLIPTLYGHCEGEDRGATLSAIKHKRRLGKQVAISKKCKRRRESIAPTHFRQYQPLATIYEENEIGADKTEQDEIFCQNFLPKKWPKFQFALFAYEYPSVAIQKATGHGAECAYCFHEFLRHRGAAADVARGAAADPMNSPVYITVCGHIICGRCICYRSRPIVPNMNALYRRKYPYVASDYAGMACPACNVAYSWSQLYNF